MSSKHFADNLPSRSLTVDVETDEVGKEVPAAGEQGSRRNGIQRDKDLNKQARETR